MRKRKKRATRSKLGILRELAREYLPSQILETLAREYRGYPRRSSTGAEQEFWIKVSRSTANLASGMDKWVEEWLDEEKEKARK